MAKGSEIAGRQKPVINGVFGPDELTRKVIEGGISNAQQKVFKEVDGARKVLGISDIGRIAKELAGSSSKSRAERGMEMAAEMRDATLECIQMFQRRGYDVRALGEGYQKALGHGNFREAELITQEDAPLDVVDTVVRKTDETWDKLRGGLGEQARLRVIASAGSPESKETVEKRVEKELKAVWMNAQPKLGSKLEDLRSSIGLRTLAALMERFSQHDSAGFEDAMEKAGLWAERAYWLTKNSIMFLMKSPKYGEFRDGLQEIGAQYERDLGDQGPNRGLNVPVGETGWPLVSTIIQTTNSTWNQLKNAIPKEKQ